MATTNVAEDVAVAQGIAPPDPLDGPRGSDLDVVTVFNDSKMGRITGLTDQTDTNKHYRFNEADYPIQNFPGNMSMAGTVSCTVSNRSLHFIDSLVLWMRIKYDTSADTTGAVYTLADVTTDFADFDDDVCITIDDECGETISFHNGTAVGDRTDSSDYVITSTIAGTAAEMNAIIEKYKPWLKFRVKDVSAVGNPSTNVTITLIGYTEPPKVIVQKDTGAPVFASRTLSGAQAKGLRLAPTYTWIDNLEIKYGGQTTKSWQKTDYVHQVLANHDHHRMSERAEAYLNNYSTGNPVTTRKVHANCVNSSMEHTICHHIPPKYQGSFSNEIMIAPGQEKWIAVPVPMSLLTKRIFVPSLRSTFQFLWTLDTKIFSANDVFNSDSATATTTLSNIKIQQVSLRAYGRQFESEFVEQMAADFREFTFARRYVYTRVMNLTTHATSMANTSGSKYTVAGLPLQGTFANLSFRPVFENTSEIGKKNTKSLFQCQDIHQGFDTVSFTDSGSHAYGLSEVHGVYKTIVEAADVRMGTANHHIRYFQWPFSREIRAALTNGMKDGYQYLNGNWNAVIKPYNYSEKGVNSTTTTNFFSGKNAYLEVTANQFMTAYIKDGQIAIQDI